MSLSPTAEKAINTLILDFMAKRWRTLRDNRFYTGWYTVKDIARELGCSNSKARYYLEYLVTSRHLIWRWSPQGRGWFQWKEYRQCWER